MDAKGSDECKRQVLGRCTHVCAVLWALLVTADADLRSCTTVAKYWLDAPKIAYNKPTRLSNLVPHHLSLRDVGLDNELVELDTKIKQEARAAGKQTSKFVVPKAPASRGVGKKRREHGPAVHLKFREDWRKFAAQHFSFNAEAIRASTNPLLAKLTYKVNVMRGVEVVLAGPTASLVPTVSLTTLNANTPMLLV